MLLEGRTDSSRKALYLLPLSLSFFDTHTQITRMTKSKVTINLRPKTGTFPGDPRPALGSTNPTTFLATHVDKRGFCYENGCYTCESCLNSSRYALHHIILSLIHI